MTARLRAPRGRAKRSIWRRDAAVCDARRRQCARALNIRHRHRSQSCRIRKAGITMQRFLVVVGLVLVAAGLLWPWLVRLSFWQHLGRLPGDIHIQRDGFSFYFPITTGLLISAVITLVLWLLKK
jgi:hypothetical protein